MKYWELIADNLSKGGWSWGCVSAKWETVSVAESVQRPLVPCPPQLVTAYHAETSRRGGTKTGTK
jgi:hypothetical protein